MKALTVCQPYPELILSGVKRVENRTWATRYRGPIALHAGKSRAWLAPGEETYYETIGKPLIFGAVIGVVDLVDIEHIDRIRAADGPWAGSWLAEHEHAHGPYCWILDRPRRFKPIPYTGKQGLWQFPDSLLPAGA